MPAPTDKTETAKGSTGRPPVFPPRWHVYLLCAIILGAAGLYASHYRQPQPPEPAAAATAEPGRPAAGHQTQSGPSPEKAAALAAMPSIWPAKGSVTSGFGWRVSPFGEGEEMHPGVDIARAEGTPVVATADGRVVESGPAGGYGNLVHIDHGNGMATLYGHNSQLAVSVGQTVSKGQVIAYAGSTGKSTGPHVHYEVRENGVAVDPWKYMVRY